MELFLIFYGFRCDIPHILYTSQNAAYKKAPVGTTDEVSNGTILPVDRLGTIEVDLDQPGVLRPSL